QKSIVPTQEKISDIEARIMLTELFMASGQQEHLARARSILEPLSESLPDDNRVLIMLIRLELISGHRNEALFFMDELYVQENDPDILMELADMYASLGHYERCRDLYLDVIGRLDGSKKQEAMSFFADRTMLWGDFYLGENILRSEIQESPQDPERYQRLSRNLMARQRYELAGKNLDKALSIEGKNFSATHEEIQADKLNLALLERDFGKAAQMSSQFMDDFGPGENRLLTLARSYYLNGHIQKARELYQHSIEYESLEYEGLVNLGRLAEEDDETDLALEYYSRAARENPARPDAVLSAMMLRQESLDAYVNELVSQEKDPANLEELAWLLADNKEYDLAVNCLETALFIDNDFFPARMSLSELYGIMGEYEKSLDILAELESRFPQTFKISLTRARTLAWSRQYDQALDAYEEIFAVNDENHIAMIEAGRTAYWGKMADRGDDFYSKLFEPAVDEMLWNQLAASLENMTGFPQDIMDDLQAKIHSGSIYTGYE
ncbi:MAG: tetratricopeptide repeat protein, partial [Desulfonatronovibrio sp.]